MFHVEHLYVGFGHRNPGSELGVNLTVLICGKKSPLSRYHKAVSFGGLILLSGAI